MRACDWPLIELLNTYMHIIKERAFARFNHECMLYTMAAPHSKKKLRPPVKPSILD